MSEVDRNQIVSSKKKFHTFFHSGLQSLSTLTAPLQPPKWLDKELYQEGIQFFWDHVLIIFMVLAQNITTGLSVPNLRYTLLTSALFSYGWYVKK